MTRPRKLLFLLFLYGSGMTASAQSTFGSISGVVRDPQGALVPNATVTLHQQQGNADRSLTTAGSSSRT